MGIEAHDAARRLGALTEFLDATDVPEEARAAARLGKPEEFMLVRDGREQHGENLIVWLARGVSETAYVYEVIGRAAILPRHGSTRPGIYAQAEKLGIPCESIARPGKKNVLGKQGIVRVVGGGKPDLTGCLVEIMEDA